MYVPSRGRHLYFFDRVMVILVHIYLYPQHFTLSNNRWNCRLWRFQSVQRLLKKSSNEWGVFPADNHSGDALHVLQSVRVKVHQKLPHPGPHGWEGKLDRHFLAWSYIPTEMDKRKALAIVLLSCLESRHELKCSTNWSNLASLATKACFFNWNYLGRLCFVLLTEISHFPEAS